MTLTPLAARRRRPMFQLLRSQRDRRFDVERAACRHHATQHADAQHDDPVANDHGDALECEVVLRTGELGVSGQHGTGENDRGANDDAQGDLVPSQGIHEASAERVGGELRAHGIITGEAIGQVSSQTAVNLRAIEPAAGLPVFRPLIGFDKEDIIALAREIGTAALSEQVKEYCAMTPGRPVTAASVVESTCGRHAT